jgi:hypothetical protein
MEFLAMLASPKSFSRKGATGAKSQGLTVPTQLTGQNNLLGAARPSGAMLLASLFLVIGLWMFWDRTSQLVRAYSSGAEVFIHPIYYVSRGTDAVTAGTALVAAAGLFAARPWGWGLALFHCYWRLQCHFLLPIGSALFMGTLAGAEQAKLSQAGSTGVILALIVCYLMLSNVMAYFQIDRAQRLRANGIAFGLSFPLALGLDLLAFAFQKHIPFMPMDASMS